MHVGSFSQLGEGDERCSTRESRCLRLRRVIVVAVELEGSKIAAIVEREREEWAGVSQVVVAGGGRD